MDERTSSQETDNSNEITNIRWADSIGKKLIKDIQVEIHIPTTEKKCIKCATTFIYSHSDDYESLKRILYFNKSGNLDVCLDCDK